MKRTHCLLSPLCFERGDNWCRAWWGALEKALSNERHNLQLPKPGGEAAFIPHQPAPPILEASEWEQELEGEAPAAIQCHTILLLPRSPEEAMGVQHLTLKPILQSAI